LKSLENKTTVFKVEGTFGGGK